MLAKVHCTGSGGGGGVYNVTTYKAKGVIPCKIITDMAFGHR